ncbi:DUF1304 domain-containing protein [Demequina mangrovi]|uniref:Putative membrane protein n=1 Tax=Demequina mangrovi TaxID=1043493 RepID=A0A1H6ZHD0_9MICO|nr:DUF1304 domain-containing protein [Demequina mangrovi]SEJ52963.1 putative membrane protein [Demequina mangrovi]
MLVATCVLAVLAALIHVGIFWLESLAWMRPETREVFGIASEHDAQVTRALAFNQGFYNLFLAIVTSVGIVLLATGSTAAGAALVYAGCGSMTAAALVLVSGSRRYARAAALQGVVPLLAVLALTVSLV